MIHYRCRHLRCPQCVFTGWTLPLKPGLGERLQHRVLEKGLAFYDKR